MNTLNIVKSSIIAIGLITMVSCVDLEPHPLSFYAPENTYNTKEGLEAGLNTCRKQIKWEWFGDAFSNLNPLVFEYAYSDMSVMGSPETKEIHNLEIQLTPESDISAYMRYWEYCWNGIKYANTIVSRVETVEGISEQDKNALLSEAYFHRAYWYYLLTHQWGDVPLIIEEVAEPKIDFNSVSRAKILHQMKADMEFAVKWLPKDVTRGAVNRAAGEHLLTKLYLSVGEFQNAVDAATRCINDNGLSLMKTRFGKNASNASLDVFNDLFGEVNISDAANKEAIFVLQERYGLLGNVQGNGSQRMRNYVPYWSNGAAVKTPDGKQGTTFDTGPYDGYEQVAELGRGISKIRPSNYHQYEIWKNYGNDMRRNNNNWYDINTLKYNRPPSKSGSATWFGKPVQRAFVTDTMRCYYSFPRVKVLIYKDDINKGKTPSGGFTDQYVFRLAETYLMRAEAYYWLNNIPLATKDVNEIRSRAKAPTLTSVTLDDILDERARELFIEEHRKTELTRIAFIMAQLGKDGYNLKDFSTKNWYYDRIMEKNNFYREQYFYSTNAFVMKPYHVLWPVPHKAITANTMGRINQNIGYPGAENNIPVE
ncbi:RagB/SusD family nutrient uptake outer membrane protein [Dysgonomonas termitidis]|uniref:RagB/SusD family nutrient uptake outer membrane protein n=1 Tax=Dysgonomonas termitidis TaxID=1516126 RepID=A0ABV9L0C8_9BACT